MANHPNPRTGQAERSAMELIEEAVHLLRSAPLRILLMYSVGTLPFIAGMLFFCLEVRVSPNAWDIIAIGSFALALLYVWLVAWQAAFAQELWALRLGQTSPMWTWRAIVAMASTQARWKSWGLYALPISAIFLMPFPWCDALLHNIGTLGTGPSTPGTMLHRPRGISHSFSLASQQLRQTIQIQLFGRLLYVLVYINLFMLLLFGNLLLHLIMGIETPLGENMALYFSVPVQLALCGATYFVANPLMKTVFLLRCVYGLSRETGDDLLAGLRTARARIAVREEKSRIHAPAASTSSPLAAGAASRSSGSTSGNGTATARASARAASMLVLSALLLLATPVPYAFAESRAAAAKSPAPAPAPSSSAKAPAPAPASPTSPALTPPSHSPSAPSPALATPDQLSIDKRSQEIGRSLERVFAGPDYDWRDASGVKVKPIQQPSYLKSIGDYLWSWVKWWRNLRKSSEKYDPDSESSSTGFWSFLQFGPSMSQMLIIIGVLGVLIAVCVFILRKRRPAPAIARAVAVPAPVAPPVNVEDEQVLASALPEDEWRALAEKLRQEGNFRLALRALYLGTLAHLARRDFISIARAKSTRNYRRELQMRARNVPPVLTAFEGQSQDFERIWYGQHPSTAPLFDLFLQRYGNIEAASGS